MNKKMNKSRAVLIITLVYLLISSSIFGQSPERISYQAVIRNSSGQLVTNTQVGMQISIIQGSASNPAVYLETQTPTTNANGLVSIEIGAGTSSDNFSEIDWSDGPYFIKTQIDPAGGINYSITGTSQLLSVPYALHAKTAETVTGGITESDPVFGSSIAGGITATDTANWNNKQDQLVAGSNISLEGNTISATSGVPAGNKKGDMQYWDGTTWITLAAGNEGATLQIVGGVPTWTDNVSGGGSTPNVTNPATGKTWMDRNLGASQVADSSTDAASYGDLYQWGRGTDGHEKRNSATTSTLSNSDTPGHGNFILTTGPSPNDWRSPQNDNLWQGVNGINNPCPSGYRVPTDAEWDAERKSWTSNNAAGAFGSPLKLPMAGTRSFSNGMLQYVGLGGNYWSSTVSSAASRRLAFGNAAAGMGNVYRAIGHSVRCIKD